MTRIRTALFIALALGAGHAFASEDISKVNGGIHTESGQTYGDLETVNGSIQVATGAITDQVGTVNGGINIETRAATGALETVNGGIKLDRDVTVNGGIATVNGSIFVDRGGKVKDGVETVNGAIGLVGTHLGGGISTVNGDITVGIDSVVKGGIKIEKNNSWLQLKPKRDPRIVIGPNAVVEGPLVFERAVKLYVHKTARIGAVTGATAQSFDTPTAPAE